jgi:hypothetical protein
VECATSESLLSTTFRAAINPQLRSESMFLLREILSISTSYENRPAYQGIHESNRPVLQVHLSFETIIQPSLHTSEITKKIGRRVSKTICLFCGYVAWWTPQDLEPMGSSFPQFAGRNRDPVHPPQCCNFSSLPFLALLYSMQWYANSGK